MKNVAFNVTKIRVKKGQEAYAKDQERKIIEAGLIAKELQRQKDAEELEGFGVFADLAPGMDDAAKHDAQEAPPKKHVNLNKIGREAPAPRKQIQRAPVAQSRLKPQEVGAQYPEGMSPPEVPVHDARIRPAPRPK